MGPKNIIGGGPIGRLPFEIKVYMQKLTNVWIAPEHSLHFEMGHAKSPPKNFSCRIFHHNGFFIF
jgi:hypothetical protein